MRPTSPQKTIRLHSPEKPPAPMPPQAEPERSPGRRAMQAVCSQGGSIAMQQLAELLGEDMEPLHPLIAGLRHNGYVATAAQDHGIWIQLTGEGRSWAERAGIAVTMLAPISTTPMPQETREAPPAENGGQEALALVAPSKALPERSDSEPASTRRPVYKVDENGYVTHINGGRIG